MDEKTEYACECEANWHLVGTKCPEGKRPILTTGPDWIDND